MAAENAADRSAFLHADGFGAAATYTPPAGAATSITVVLDTPGAASGLGQLGAKQLGYAAWLSRDEVATQPADGGTLVVGAQTFTVRGLAAMDRVLDGFWYVDLQLQ